MVVHVQDSELKQNLAMNKAVQVWKSKGSPCKILTKLIKIPFLIFQKIVCGQYGPVIHNVPKHVALDQKLEQGLKSKWRKMEELAQDLEGILDLVM